MKPRESSSDEDWEKLGVDEVKAASSACAVEDVDDAAVTAAEAAAISMPGTPEDQRASDAGSGAKVAGSGTAAPGKPHHPAQAAAQGSQLGDQQVKPAKLGGAADLDPKHAAQGRQLGDQQTKPAQLETGADPGPKHAAEVEDAEDTVSASVLTETSSHRSSEPQPRMVTLKEAAAVPLPASSAATEHDSDSTERSSDLSLVSQVQQSRLQGASGAEKHAALLEALSALRPTLGLKLCKQLQQQLLTPTILAIGPPSSGKSSLLEGLSRCPIFPHDSRLGSIAAVRLETSPCDMQDQPKYEVTFNGECFAFFRMEEVRPCVTGILELRAASHHPRSREEVHVVVSEPGLPHLNLVDLPSINHGSVAHKEAAWEVAKTYLALPGTIALCVSSAVSPFEWRTVDASLGEKSSAKRTGTGSLIGPGNPKASPSKRGSKREPGAAKSGNRGKSLGVSESWVNAKVDEVASRETSIAVITMADLAPDGLLQPSLFGPPETAVAAQKMMSEQCQLESSSQCCSPSIKCSKADSDAEPESPSNPSAGRTSQRRGPDKWAAISEAISAETGQHQQQPARCAVISGEHAASDTQQSFAESEELEASLFQNMLDATGLKLPGGSWEDLASEQPPGSLKRSSEQQQPQGQQRDSVAGCLGMQNLRQRIARSEGMAADEVRESVYKRLKAASAEGRLALKALSTNPASLHVPTLLANISQSISHEAIFSAVMKCPTRASCPDTIPSLLQGHPQLSADLFTPSMTLRDLEKAWEGVILAQLPPAQSKAVSLALCDEMSHSIKLWLGGVHTTPLYLLHVQDLIFADLIQLDPLLREYPLVSVTMKRRLHAHLEVGIIAASVQSMVDPLLAALRESLDDSLPETGDLDSMVHVAAAQAVYSAFADGLVMRLLPEGYVLKEAGSAAEKRKAANLTLESACKATIALKSFGDSFGFREGFAQQLPNAAVPNLPAASSRPQAEAESSAAAVSQDMHAQESVSALQSSQPEPAAAKPWTPQDRASLYVFNTACPTASSPEGSWQLQVDPAAYTFDKRNLAWPTIRGSPGWFLSLSSCLKAEIGPSREDDLVCIGNVNLVVFHAGEHEPEKRICALHFHDEEGYHGFVKQYEAREFENATSMAYRDDILRGLDHCEDNGDLGDLEAENEAADDTTGISDGEYDQDDESAPEEDGID